MHSSINDPREHWAKREVRKECTTFCSTMKVDGLRPTVKFHLMCSHLYFQNISSVMLHSHSFYCARQVREKKIQF